MTEPSATGAVRNRSMLVGIATQIFSFPLMCGVVALFHEFPILMAGVQQPGGETALAAAVTAAVNMTFFSLGIGIVIAAAVGAFVAWLLKPLGWWWIAGGCVAVSGLFAYAYAAIGASI